MNIKVIGAGCEECTRLYRNTMDALQDTGISAEVEKVEELMDIVRLGVMSAPSLMIDKKLVVSGRVASKEEIVKLLKK